MTEAQMTRACSPSYKEVAAASKKKVQKKFPMVLPKVKKW